MKLLEIDFPVTCLECGQVVNPVYELEFNYQVYHRESLYLCPECLYKLRRIVEDENRFYS